jgi:hypothetical protein
MIVSHSRPHSPVSVDTASDALLAMDGGCIHISAQDHSGWNQRTRDNSGL